MPIKYKIKRKIVSMYIILFVPFVIGQYFLYEDVFYNPFEHYNFTHTRFSVKSVFLGSYVNMLLFIAKPIIIDITRWFQRLTGCTKVKHSDSSLSSSNQQFERLVCPYKRCKVKWQTKRKSYTLLQG